MRFDQCTETCTTDCGHCKGRPVETLRAELAAAETRAFEDAEARVELEADRRTLRAELAALRQQLDEARAKGERWRRLAVDLTRCEHGRVQLDTCSQCPQRYAPSRAARPVGYSLDGTYRVVVPTRGVQADPDAWYVLAESATFDDAEADRDRLLVVYRAAKAWAHTLFGAVLDTIAGDEDHYSSAELRLIAAVDAYRSAAPAEPAPAKTLLSLDNVGSVFVPAKVGDTPGDRHPGCVEKWPECFVGGYDPRCCRFPKSCSCWKEPAAVPVDTEEADRGQA